jgi:hypothetical protein
MLDANDRDDLTTALQALGLPQSVAHYLATDLGFTLCDDSVTRRERENRALAIARYAFRLGEGAKLPDMRDLRSRLALD